MSDLLEMAIEAHGGRERWNEVKRLRISTTAGGGLWALKHQPTITAENTWTLDTRQPHTEVEPFGAGDRVGVYTPAKTMIVGKDGGIVGERQDPRSAFNGHTLMTPWDELDTLYFGGYAIWTYFTTPFLFDMPGFETTEINPWDTGEGETWRRLSVTFPDSVPTHCKTQTFYFDATGLLRRQDYSVDIMGGTDSANYALETKSFGGLIFPTKRRIYSRGPDNKPIIERLVLTIDVHDIVVE